MSTEEELADLVFKAVKEYIENMLAQRVAECEAQHRAFVKNYLDGVQAILKIDPPALPAGVK